MEALSLGPWATQRRKELLELLDSLGPRLEELSQAVKVQAGQRSDCQELMKVKEVGPVTSLAYVLTLGPVERFADSRKLVSYLGVNPSEHSSGSDSATLVSKGIKCCVGCWWRPVRAQRSLILNCGASINA